MSSFPPSAINILQKPPTRQDCTKLSIYCRKSGVFYLNFCKNSSGARFDLSRTKDPGAVGDRNNLQIYSGTCPNEARNLAPCILSSPNNPGKNITRPGIMLPVTKPIAEWRGYRSTLRTIWCRKRDFEPPTPSLRMTMLYRLSYCGLLGDLQPACSRRSGTCLLVRVAFKLHRDFGVSRLPAYE